jgi:hypothetical protein
MPDPTQHLLLDVPATHDQAIELLREHTGERWEEKYPHLAELACQLYRVHGCYKKVAEDIAPLCGKDGEGQADGLRKIIRPTIIRRLGAVEVTAIMKATTMVTTMEGVAKTAQLIDQAQSTKDLGAVAMATQIIHGVHQLLVGGATRITGKTSDASADVDFYKKRAQEKMAARAKEAVEVEAVEVPSA